MFIAMFSAPSSTQTCKHKVKVWGVNQQVYDVGGIVPCTEEESGLR